MTWRSTVRVAAPPRRPVPPSCFACVASVRLPAGPDACYRYPFGPLSHDNVMAYFAGSCFYDRRANNERVGGRAHELPSLTGVEYVEVATAHTTGPELMAVERRVRSGPRTTHTEAVYYVLDGTVYQCPDLHTLLRSRLVRGRAGLSGCAP